MKCLMRADLEISFPCSCNCPLYRDCVAACNAEWNAKMEAAAVSSPMTKADRVRSMNDEELAELLFRAAHDPNKPLNKQEVLEMLRAPAKEAK